MKQREISQSGRINKNGKLEIFMGEINQFFAKWKDTHVIAKFVVCEGSASEALRGYYYHCVVPTFKSALWESGERKTEEQTERYMRELSPIMQDEIPDLKSGKYNSCLREISDLSNAELLEHIETIKEIAALEYSAYIPDPNEIVK